MLKKWLYTLVLLLFSVAYTAPLEGHFGDARVVDLAKGAGKVYDDMLLALKNNTSLKEHIFKGDYRNVTGCHYRAGVDGVNVRFVNNSIPEGNSLGVLKGDIEMRRPLLDAQGNITGYKWELKPTRDGSQTFFPQTWSQDEILEQCASALANPKKALVPGKTRMYTAESKSGVFMKWFEDTNGNVTSIFPEFY